MAARDGASADEQGALVARPLDTAEEELLHFLLAVETEGVAELRVQARHALVGGRCPCGCPTIELVVDPRAAPTALNARAPVFSWARAARTAQSSYHVVLFIAEGRLSELEYVSLSDPVPTTFPPISDLAPAVSGDVPLGPVGAPA